MGLPHSKIPEKASKVLNVILITLIIFVIRLWHLSIIQYNQRLEESKRPQKKVVVEAAKRATIRDRFNIPLAMNKVQYRAAILYSQFRQIPSFIWNKTEDGKKTRVYKRKEYIIALSKVLSEELQIDQERLEDLIFSKASLYYHRPFVIKEDLSEKEYYRLKMLEKDWVGIQVQRLPKRIYPLGKVGADIVGYMGAINQQEYEAIISEIKALEKYIKEYEKGEEPFPLAGISGFLHAKKHLKELQEKAYTLNDSVGKTGIEAQFDAELRGFQGIKYYYSDARGNFLRELPGSRDPLPGHRFLLTISSELQEYSEKLLIQNERIREAKISNPKDPKKASTKQPWIKGGTIIAMDPNNGEILAMASYPRFDPNDFIFSGNGEETKGKQKNVLRWLENEDYIAQMWDQKIHLERERYDDNAESIVDEGMKLSWDVYLDRILPHHSDVRNGLNKLENLENIIEFQHAVVTLLELSCQTNLYWLFDILFQGEGHSSFGQQMPKEVKLAIEENLDLHYEEVARQKKIIDLYLKEINSHYEKGLLIDLCRIVAKEDAFSQDLIHAVKNQTFSFYRNASASFSQLEPVVKGLVKSLFHDIHFREWRSKNGKSYIQQKRTEEKQAHKYAKPSLDYLDEQENELFSEFWIKNRLHLLSSLLLGIQAGEELQPYYQPLVDWHDELLNGAHLSLAWREPFFTLQEAIKGLSIDQTQQYLNTLRSFKELNRPLLGQYRHLKKIKGKQLEKHLAAGFYPTYGFGYGRSYAYRQSSIQGSLFKLVTAYTALAQQYKKVGAKHANQKNINPLTMVDFVFRNGKDVCVGYHADGSPIPQFYKGGRIPQSITKTLGKLDITRAIETSSNPYFALLAHDVIERPQDLIEAAKNFSYGKRTGIDLPGEISGQVPSDIHTNPTGLFCTSIGQHTLVVTPLQSTVMVSAIANGGKIIKPQIVHMVAGMDTESFNEKKERYKKCQEPKTWLKLCRTEVRNEIFMPDLVRQTLLQGMHHAVTKMQQHNLSNLSNFYRDYPEAISDYLDIKDSFVGKTSTAEANERIDLDPIHGVNKYTHVWFGGISFDQEDNLFVAKDEFGKPELVVIVYLRFGKYGKEAAPIAAQVVKKWREIKEKQAQGI